MYLNCLSMCHSNLQRHDSQITSNPITEKQKKSLEGKRKAESNKLEHFSTENNGENYNLTKFKMIDELLYYNNIEPKVAPSNSTFEPWSQSQDLEVTIAKSKARFQRPKTPSTETTTKADTDIFSTANRNPQQGYSALVESWCMIQLVKRRDSMCGLEFTRQYKPAIKGRTYPKRGHKETRSARSANCSLFPESVVACV